MTGGVRQPRGSIPGGEGRTLAFVTGLVATLGLFREAVC